MITTTLSTIILAGSGIGLGLVPGETRENVAHGGDNEGWWVGEGGEEAGGGGRG